MTRRNASRGTNRGPPPGGPLAFGLSTRLQVPDARLPSLPWLLGENASRLDGRRAVASRSLRVRNIALVVGAAIALSTSACGSSGTPTPQPFTEQAVIAAYRKAGVSIPVVLRAGKSCHPDRWPVSPSTESTKAATLYACGRLEDAGIDTTNLPQAVLLVGGFTPAPNYLISVYADLNHAAAVPFWLRTSFVPQPKVPVSAERTWNVVAAGVMTPSDLAATKKAFANLKP